MGLRSRDQVTLASKLGELSGTSTARARELLRGNQRILESVAPALALAFAVQIERAGGVVEFELGQIERLGFWPEHPLRGMQPCERLMILNGALVLARGPLAGPAEIETLRPRGHAGELLDAFDRERARWAAAGMAEAVDEAGLLRRVAAHEARLDGRLREARHPALLDCAAIYGDWLQAHGDARGLIASASLALARAGDDPAAREQAAATLAQLVDEHGSHLLGSLIHELRPGALRWLGPTLHAVRLAPTTVTVERPPRMLALTPCSAPEDAAELEQLAFLAELGLLERLLALPVSAHLRGLELVDAFTRHPEVPARLAAAPCAGTLELLAVHGSLDWRMSGDAFARLRRLVLRRAGGELRCDARLPALRRLELEVVESPDLLASLAELDAPRLAHFELRIADAGARPASMVAQLGALLERPSFARLRSLTLRSSSKRSFAGIERTLARIPAKATLERVDIGPR